jgi:hypothetical protein
MVYCLSAIFGVGRMLSRERSHLEAERNRSQNINRIPHDYECTNTEEAALVAPALRWISLIGGYTVLREDVRFVTVRVVEEEGKSKGSSARVSYSEQLTGLTGKWSDSIT